MEICYDETLIRDFPNGLLGGNVVTLNTSLASNKFTNEGTITLNYTGNAVNINQNAVMGSAEIVNNGTIRVSGASAVRGENSFNETDRKFYLSTLLNTGLIEQTAALVNPIGIANVQKIDNRGIISTFGTSIATPSPVAPLNGAGPVEFARITNSGTIRSSNAVAIQGSSGTFFLDNLAGGTISGGAGQAAITATSRATITNSGTINGNVALNSNQGALSNVFISKGGTLNGNLTFGGGDDIFVSTGATTGVTGTLNGGAGTDTFVTALTADGTVDIGGLTLAPTFERLGVGSLGTNTVVTATGPAGGLNQNILFYGDGKIVNQANINASGAIINNVPGNVAILGRLITSASDPKIDFTNQGVLADGVNGQVRRLVNSGTIGNANLINVPVVRLDSVSTNSFVFENSGSILRNPMAISGLPQPDGYGTVIFHTAPNTPPSTVVSLNNSGLMQGGLRLDSRITNTFEFTNSGTVTGYTLFVQGNPVQGPLALDIDVGTTGLTPVGFGRFTNSMSGLVTGDTEFSINTDDLVFTNAGTINGEVDISQTNDGETDFASATITNSGTITASLSPSNGGEVLTFNNETESGVKTLNFSNSGTIRLTKGAADQGESTESATVVLANVTLGNQTVRAENSGTIVTEALGDIAFGVGSLAGDFSRGGPAANVVMEITNSGTIQSNAGAISTFNGVGTTDVAVSAGLVAAAGSSGTAAITINNTATGKIEATGNLRQGYDGVSVPVGNPNVAGATPGFGSVALGALGGNVTINNAGQITGGAGSTFRANQLLYTSFGDVEDLDDLIGFDGDEDFASYLPDRYLAGAIQTFGSTDTLNNAATGVITGSVDLGALNDKLNNQGTINGNVFLRDGDDAVRHLASGRINGIVDGGAGADTVVIDITGNGLLDTNPYVNFETTSVTGTGTVTVNGPLTINTINLVDANLTLAAGNTLKTAGPVALTYGAGSTVTNLGTIDSNVNNSTSFTNAAGGVVTGALNNTGGTAVNSGAINGAVTNAATFENRTAGAVVGALSNAGTTTNAGTLAAVSNAAAGTFSNLVGGTTGAFDNAGTVTNAGTAAAVANGAGGSFANLAGANTGAFANAGTTTNAGSVASLANSAGTFGNTGSVTGQTTVSGGVVTTSGTLAGGLVNSATVNANGGAINGAVANNGGGIINIAGTVTSDRTFQNTAATAALNVNSGTYTIGGLLTNAGGIVVEGGATLVDRVGVVNTATGTILIKAGGTLIDALDNAGSVTNGGTYTADVNNSTATGVITNTATGVWTGNLLSNTASGSVSNLGNWNGTATNAALLTNNGTWTGAVGNEAGGTLSNAGTLSGTVANAGTFDNAGSGSVSGLLTNTGGTATNAGTLSGGAAVNGGALSNTGVIVGSTNVTSGGQLDNSGRISGPVTNAGTLNQSGGSIANTLTNTGTVNATGGALNGVVANNAGGVINVNGAVTSSSSLTNSGTINFASGALTLTGAATNTGVLNFNGGALGASSLTNASTGQITGTLNFTGGADNLINEGQIAGDVVLGAGDDIVTIRPGGSFGAGVNAGAGNDVLLLALNGTELAPTALQLDPFIGFEVLRHTSGVSSYAGPFSIGAIEVNGGRLIGLAGSTITAPNITIANGATFGSAGRVVGNITNNGTLSPGASPGTMTVAGNVSLASGSTTLFELGTTVSDQLLISGTLSIASGATLNLTGSRPLTPGSTLDLIVADGGITGSFGTINKPASILGFVAQRGNRIQLLGQFATDAGFGAQTNATIGYVNNVLIAGQGSTALLNALPSLLTQAGGTSGGAFALISPEAYASATQIGQENGMAISTALRSSIRSQARTGPFVFGQAMGNWRQFRDDAALGTSRGNVSSTGFFAGLGIGGEMASFGAFAGYVDGRQRINALGAKTDADGMVFGLTGSLTSGKLEASASLVHDGSKASTRRTLPGGGATSASYKLKGLTADVSIGYVLSVGGNWAAKIKPWLTAGVRHQLGGDGTSATGGFKGINATYTVAGVDRRETLLSLGAGLSAQLSEGVSFNAGYRGEFGKGNAGHNVSAGIKVGF